MAEATSPLLKAECIRNPAVRAKCDSASVRDVEVAVSEYVDWRTTGACTARSDTSRPTGSTKLRGVVHEENAGTWARIVLVTDDAWQDWSIVELVWDG